MTILFVNHQNDISQFSGGSGKHVPRGNNGVRFHAFEDWNARDSTRGDHYYVRTFGNDFGDGRIAIETNIQPGLSALQVRPALGAVKSLPPRRSIGDERLAAE